MLNSAENDNENENNNEIPERKRRKHSERRKRKHYKHKKGDKNKHHRPPHPVFQIILGIVGMGIAVLGIYTYPRSSERNVRI